MLFTGSSAQNSKFTFERTQKKNKKGILKNAIKLNLRTRAFSIFKKSGCSKKSTGIRTSTHRTNNLNPKFIDEMTKKLIIRARNEFDWYVRYHRWIFIS